MLRPPSTSSKTNRAHVGQRTANLAGLNFLIGSWVMECEIPKTAVAPAASGHGRAAFRYDLNNQYIVFDYTVHLSSGKSQGHAMLTWDTQKDHFAYSWFEDTGASQTATGHLQDGHLTLRWQEMPFEQTIHRIAPDILRLTMIDIRDDGQPILRVSFRRGAAQI